MKTFVFPTIKCFKTFNSLCLQLDIVMLKSCVVPSPFTWTLNLFIITYVFFKKSIKVTQSPIVPRVRGGDPSGVAPGKVEGFFSAPGHPWKLFSWKLRSPVHPCWNQWCLDVHFSQEGSKNQPSSWSIIIFLLLIHKIINVRKSVTTLIV